MLVGVGVDLRAEDTVIAPAAQFAVLRMLQGAPQVESTAAQGSDGSASAADEGASAVFFAVIAKALIEQTRKSGNLVLFSVDREVSQAAEWQDLLQVAAAHRLPILLVFASSGASLVKQAESAGFAGIPVGGTDAVAVYRVATESIAQARKGNGPTLIECRFEGSETTDPIQKMQQYLIDKQLF